LTPHFRVKNTTRVVDMAGISDHALPMRPPEPAADSTTDRRVRALLALLPLFLAGCDQLGIESTAATAARREAEGKAIGAGCRHAARSVEVCYTNNKKADKAAVFAGWREMNDYMRENKIDAQPPPPEPPKPPPAPASAAEGEEGDEHDAPAKGGKAKSTKTAAKDAH
jgi:hypothetical protein